MSLDPLFQRKLDRAIAARKAAESILEKKAAELYDVNQSLLKLNSNLETKVQERTVDLELAKDEAERAQESERQFLANMSHEMRTPLNAIIGLSHLLSDTKLDENQEELLGIILHSSKMLKSLISDVLDFAKIDSGELEINHFPFNLKKLFDSFHTGISQRTSKRGLLFEYEYPEDLDIWVLSDELLINQIVINLISNAIKFTKDGKVGLRVKRVQESAANVEIMVSIYDTGLGIEKEDQSKVFDEFVRINSNENKKIVGSGLGLPIAKRIVQELGGNIIVESELGKGSNFQFNLSLDKTKEAIAQEDDKIVAKEIPKDILPILVAEDNLLNIKYLEKLLEKFNLKYVFCKNGQEAIDRAKIEEFSLIFMDIHMPIKDGFEATTEIRVLNNRNAIIPIIALTASAILSFKSRSIEVGMNDFMTKPFTPNQLKKMLLKHVGQEIESDESLLLNSATIDDLYGDDIEYKTDMFTTYIEVTEVELEELRAAYLVKDLQRIKSIVHKMKPTFSMVGLSQISESAEYIEGYINSDQAFDQIESKLLGFMSQIEKSILVVKEELKN